jgi:hypothetical protein
MLQVVVSRTLSRESRVLAGEDFWNLAEQDLLTSFVLAAAWAH